MNYSEAVNQTFVQKELFWEFRKIRFRQEGVKENLWSWLDPSREGTDRP